MIKWPIGLLLWRGLIMTAFFLFKKDIYNLYDRVQFGPIQQFIRSMKNSLPAQAGEIFFFEGEISLQSVKKKLSSGPL